MNEHFHRFLECMAEFADWHMNADADKKPENDGAKDYWAKEAQKAFDAYMGEAVL